jgi:hypothetical protein
MQHSDAAGGDAGSIQDCDAAATCATATAVDGSMRWIGYTSLLARVPRLRQSLLVYGDHNT